MIVRTGGVPSMNKPIIVINGSGGVGKDTFVSYCGLYCSTYNISTVDRIKKAAIVLGWNGAKTEKDRKFLSDLKLLALEYNDHSYKYIQTSIEIFKNDDNTQMMFIHAREPQEIERFKQDFGCHTLLITNKNVPQITTNMADGNVEKYNYEVIINNDDGLAELADKAREFVFEMIHKEVYNE